mgnify:CR=1 FL=1
MCAAAFLLPYASSVEELKKFCLSAARALGPGGRFISVTTVLWNQSSSVEEEKEAAATATVGKASASVFDTPKGGVLASEAWEYSIVWDTDSIHDGMLADVTLFGSDSSGSNAKTRVTFPNHFWSKDTITDEIGRAHV